MHVLCQNIHLQWRKNLSNIFVEHLHALSTTTLQKYKLSLIQEAVCSLEGLEFCSFNCVSVQQKVSTMETLFIVEIAVYCINRSAKHKNVFKGLYLPMNGRPAKVITILQHISGLLYYSTSPVHPNLWWKCRASLVTETELPSQYRALAKHAQWRIFIGIISCEQDTSRVSPTQRARRREGRTGTGK